jgi:hypothetical protein
MCAQLSQRLPRGVLVVVKLLRTLNQFNKFIRVYLGSFHTKYIIFRIFFSNNLKDSEMENIECSQIFNVSLKFLIIEDSIFST